MKVASDDDKYTSRSMQNLFNVSFPQCGEDLSTEWHLNTYDIHPFRVENYLELLSHAPSVILLSFTLGV